MNGSLIQLLVLAGIAIFLILKLRSVLGTRDGFEKPKEFVIQRGTVKVKSVKYTDMGDGFGYVRITSFIENTAADLRIAPTLCGSVT